MDDTKKQEEETSETSNDEVKDVKKEDTQVKSKKQEEDTTKEQDPKEPDEVVEETKPLVAEETETSEKQDEMKLNQEPKKEEPTVIKEPEIIKKEEKPEIKSEEKKPKKKDDPKDDFKYIVRIANTDIPGEKTIVHGITSIKGIGMHMSVYITNLTGINRNMKIGDLKDSQIEKIKNTIENINETTPGWMLNHRKDYETGDDIHLVGPEIDMRLRDEINIMKKIRCYRGIRHERGLSVRGQRTRANNRSGLTLGVSKKGIKQGK